MIALGSPDTSWFSPTAHKIVRHAEKRQSEGDKNHIPDLSSLIVWSIINQALYENYNVVGTFARIDCANLLTVTINVDFPEREKILRAIFNGKGKIKRGPESRARLFDTRFFAGTIYLAGSPLRMEPDIAVSEPKKVQELLAKSLSMR